MAKFDLKNLGFIENYLKNFQLSIYTFKKRVIGFKLGKFVKNLRLHILVISPTNESAMQHRIEIDRNSIFAHIKRLICVSVGLYSQISLIRILLLKISFESSFDVR